MVFIRCGYFLHIIIIIVYSFSRSMYKYGELFVEIRQLRPTPRAVGAPVGVTPFELEKIFGIRKLESWAIMQNCLRHPTFSRFCRTLTCDRQTDTHTQIISWPWHIPRRA